MPPRRRFYLQRNTKERTQLSAFILFIPQSHFTTCKPWGKEDTNLPRGARRLIMNVEREKQEETFRKHIELAIEMKKPLMLHLRNGTSRSAYKDAFSILNSYFILHNSWPRGNLHFFAGTIDEAKPFLDAGFFFSFTGVITFARSYNEIIRYLPLDRILSETDCPYVAPVPYRGKRNEPLYVREVVGEISRIRHENGEAVQERLLKNAREFFKISMI